VFFLADLQEDPVDHHAEAVHVLFDTESRRRRGRKVAAQSKVDREDLPPLYDQVVEFDVFVQDRATVAISQVSARVGELAAGRRTSDRWQRASCRTFS
jgi:hypothetical protein